MKKIIILIFIFFFSFTNAIAQPNLISLEALTHLNKPYIYATAGPASFDCSGFVFYCYFNIYNIELKRSAKDQGYDEQYEKINNIEELLEGDIVFFNTINTDEDLCDHSGIYLGNNRFIHCSSAKGKVIISSLTKNYYLKNFSWGRRIIRRNIYEYNDQEGEFRQYSYLRAYLR